MIRLKDYVDCIPQLTFEPVTDEIWESIQYEGLDEEADNFDGIYDRENWFYAELPLDEEDSNGLMSQNEEFLERFNQFDILLKNTYNMKYIDLINYENGKINIVTVK